MELCYYAVREKTDALIKKAANDEKELPAVRQHANEILARIGNTKTFDPIKHKEALGNAKDVKAARARRDTILLTIGCETFEEVDTLTDFLRFLGEPKE